MNCHHKSCFFNFNDKFKKWLLIYNLKIINCNLLSWKNNFMIIKMKVLWTSYFVTVTDQNINKFDLIIDKETLFSNSSAQVTQVFEKMNLILENRVIWNPSYKLLTVYFTRVKINLFDITGYRIYSRISRSAYKSKCQLRVNFLSKMRDPHISRTF